mmetsp:Transcript_16411/g.44855  ORF Transcript_16411/g.44855 Transcript_16411/m.44855 type:complete len:257 (-) Transcript_16411:51-821(-)
MAMGCQLPASPEELLWLLSSRLGKTWRNFRRDAWRLECSERWPEIQAGLARVLQLLGAELLLKVHCDFSSKPQVRDLVDALVNVADSHGPHPSIGKRVTGRHLAPPVLCRDLLQVEQCSHFSLFEDDEGESKAAHALPAVDSSSQHDISTDVPESPNACRPPSSRSCSSSTTSSYARPFAAYEEEVSPEEPPSQLDCVACVSSALGFRDGVVIDEGDSEDKVMAEQLLPQDLMHKLLAFSHKMDRSGESSRAKAAR